MSIWKELVTITRNDLIRLGMILVTLLIIVFLVLSFQQGSRAERNVLDNDSAIAERKKCESAGLKVQEVKDGQHRITRIVCTEAPVAVQ